MNQDFALLLTPANARLLQRIRSCHNIVLPDVIADLARQDMISETDFDQFVCPVDPTRMAITQFLLDSKLRGVIQQNYHPTFHELALMNAIRLGKPSSITIFTVRPEEWKIASKAFFLQDIVKTYRHFNMTGEEIDAYRNGVLIMDGDPGGVTNRLRDFSNEFAKTIYFDPKKDWNFLTPWTLYASTMFPTMPMPVYPRLVSDVPETYKQPLHLFAPLYNVCLFPEFIADRSIKEHLTDDYLHSRLQTFRRLGLE